MATNDEDFQYTREEIERLTDALKDKEFRKLFTDYCEEIQDPENRKIYQSEITQLEKQRGVDITFINPTAGYVIKTSVGGDRKAFINVCSNENVDKPTFTVQEQNGKKGVCWTIPHIMAPPHDDMDNKKNRCVVYDVVFNPGTLRMAEKNSQFKKMLNNTACDAIEKNHNVKLDRKNLKFPKLTYKGFAMASAIRKPIENFVKSEESSPDLEMLENLYPQKVHNSTVLSTTNLVNECKSDDQSLYTVPKYIIKQRREMDMSEYTNDKESGKNITLPSTIVVEVKLPLLSSSSEAKLDVINRHLSLVSEVPAKYKLDITLPYAVDDGAGSAKFELDKRLLVISLPVIVDKKNTWINREDSGVESDCNSPSVSDEDNNNVNCDPFIKEEEEIRKPGLLECDVYRTNHNTVKKFLSSDLVYTVPPFNCHVLDNTIAFTLHVKNVDPDSIIYEQLSDNSSVQLKFHSIGAGYFPIHYALFLKFPAGFEFSAPVIEPWDNNIVMQVDILSNSMPDHYFIGLEEETLDRKDLDVPVESILENYKNTEENKVEPSVEVSARGNNEVNISLSLQGSNQELEKDEMKENVIPIPQKADDKYDSGVAFSNGSSKGILKYRIPRIGRSHSESSVDWMDYCSSPGYSLSSNDCIPEESPSLKKTVRFSNVIAKQTFRTNSSILGQKNKNQRKKRNKKRAHERRSSEGDNGERESGSLEAVSDENVFSGSECGDENLVKERRDSGVVDTDDGDSPADEKSSKIREKLSSYTKQNLSQGKYQEVKFKSDLIFDLDM